MPRDGGRGGERHLAGEHLAHQFVREIRVIRHQVLKNDEVLRAPAREPLQFVREFAHAATFREVDDAGAHGVCPGCTERATSRCART